MMRRLFCASSQRNDYTITCATKATFFGGWGGNKSKSGTSTDTTSNDSNATNSSGGFPGFPPGLDAQKFQAMQQLFDSQPPEKREQMMKQALEFQKMMSKVPGLGKLTQRNQEMMEALLNMKQNEPKQGPGTFSGTSAAANRRNMREMFVPPTNTGTSNTNNSTSSSTAAPSSSSSAQTSPSHHTTSRATSSSSSSSSKGPTLDELKKVNLGPEIEALFEELRTVRNKKNSYRDKCQSAEQELQRVQKECGDLKQTESSLREKIKRSEHEVMLLTSENMTLQESSKQAKELRAEVARLQQRLQQAEKKLEDSKAVGSPSYEALSRQLEKKENSLRSMQRKLERARDSDPVLQLSLKCSELGRLCERGGDRDPGPSAVENKVLELRRDFDEGISHLWENKYYQSAILTAVFAARRFVSARVPHANLDAVIAVEGDADDATRDFEHLKFKVTAAPEDKNRLTITASSTAETLDTPGPYGYALAMRLAPYTESRYKVVSVRPFVSPELLENTKRCDISYETARASGPGGQATNVTETQVYAKLTIDKESAFTAEAQESRSAMNNKETALQKLKGPRRVQYNETLARQQRPEEVYKALEAEVAEYGGLTLPGPMHAVHSLVADGKVFSPLEECFAKLLIKLCTSE